MSQRLSYKTISHEGEAVVIEKKSRFIATVRPVSCEEDAVNFVAEIRARYPDARHNVYAYIIDENNIFRYSDDGEPSGTAGMPVLDTMRKAGIVDAAIVVTRYFGGTLLGTGGLVHTYSRTAREGLESAEIVTRVLSDVVSVRLDYTLEGKLRYKLATDGIAIENAEYTNDVTLEVCMSKADTARFIAEVTDLTGGKAVCEIIGERYADRAE